MRAPFSLFGSISPRVFAPALVVLILSAFTNANAQLSNPGLGGGFEVDGNLFSNNPGGIIGLGDDWLTGPAGPGSGVLNKNGSPKNPATTIHILDGTGGADLDVFDGSNKVDANPNSYKWKTGSAPNKDDIQNGLAYFSEDNSGNHWMRVAGDRQSNSGDSYIDYEFLQTTLTKNPNGTFSSAGTASGRTIGDILLTIHLTQGGSQAEFYAQRWQAVGAGYDYVTIPFPNGQAFSAANIDSTISSSYNVFGTKTYGKNQFGEAAVNLDALLPNFSHCFGIATVFVRTKSATSAQAVLKDFIEPVQVNMCLDHTPPVLTPPLDVTLRCDQSTSPGTIGVGTATDDCDTNVKVDYVDNIIPGGCAQNYTIERTWTAVDHCGNSATAMQTIHVVDNTGPVIVSSPGPLTIQCSGDIPNPNPTSVTTSGECGKVTVTHISDVSDGNTCPQVITRTYRASDECGNFTDVTQKITIDDTTAPTVGTLSPITVQCSGDVPAANINVVQASDNCGQVTIVHLSDASNHQSCPEVITRTYRVTDRCGNITDRTQTITIKDDIPPSVGLIYPATVQCKDNVPAPNIALVSASDNCSTPVVRFLSDVSDGKTCPEVITRTYRVTDACGNATDRIQQITIKDTTNPSISGPGDVTVSCAGQIPAANKSLINASDNCSTPVVTIVGDVSDGKSCPQVILRTYRATDACGNASDWVQKITVQDKTAPTASPLADINVSCASEVPSPDTGSVQASDNGCGQVYVSFLGDQTLGNGCGGKIVRSYRVADQCGNAITITQRIIVSDKTPPVVTSGPQPVTIQCEGDIPAVDISSIHATDNCGAVRIVWSSDATDGNSCPKVIDRRYNVLDPCNNLTTFHQKITIDDTTAPSLSGCGSNQNLECPSQIQFTTPKATDNCDQNPAVNVISEKTTYGPAPWTYSMSKTFQAVDKCGNASQQCQQTLTIHCEADHLCSLTQGAYGSYGGYFNGMTTIQLVRSLLQNNPMLVGMPGRSLYMDYNDADCIILRLPGNTTPSALPAFGDQVLNQSTCQVPGAIPIPLNSGKFESVLLGQTVTLIFNSRISAAMPLFPLTNHFCTQAALPGKDGLYGTADDVRDVNDPIKTFTIRLEVLSALDKLGLPRNVWGLIQLCNRALAGRYTMGASLSSINDAADAINNGFENCRFIVDCTGGASLTGVQARVDDPNGMAFSTNAPTRFELKQNAPNPFNPVTTIRLALPQATPWTITVYDIQGKLVKKFDGQTNGAAYVDVQWNGTDQNGSPVASGVYLYRVRADHYVDVKKMVLLK